MTEIKRFLSTTLLLFFAGSVLAQTDLGVASYNDQNELVYPDHMDEWVHMGSSVGGEYGDEPFDPENPGTLGIVLMEPTAYRYFKENREYADGTMFLLSFYASEAESDPQLPGFVQGNLRAQEIHVIDSERFAEGRGFFLYPVGSDTSTAAAKLPDNSTCVQCHIPEGDYDGTFTQFYPPLRDLLTD